MSPSSTDRRPKAYSYIRMSTDIQLKGDSLRRQLEASKRYAETHGLDLVRDLRDIGISGYSGKNIASGEFGRFLAAVRSGEIEKGSYLLVESFDRISRQEPIVALQPLMEIINAGLILVTLDDQRKFSGKISFEDLIISIAKMSRANEESARKSDRLSAAWQAKRNAVAHKKLTARCPSWLRLSADRAGFEVVEEKAAIVRRIFSEARSGLGVHSIVRRLNNDNVPTFLGGPVWQNSTVNKIISGPAAIGTFQPNKMVNGKRQPDGPPIKDYFPRIVSDEEYYGAQADRLARRTAPVGNQRGSGGRKGQNYSNLFSKLAVCAYCSHPMRFINKGKPPKGGTYLTCSVASRSDRCPMRGLWRYDHFEEVFLKFVDQLDLASMVASEQHSETRRKLSFEVQAVEGALKLADQNLELAFNASAEIGAQASAFLAKKVGELEHQIAELRKRRDLLNVEISQIDLTALAYYESSDAMRDLIEQIRSRNGGDVYRIRAQIASRLQALVSELRLLLPLHDHDDEQQFEVNFRDGAHLMVFVDTRHPTKIKQIVRATSEYDIQSTDENGNTINVPIYERREG